MKKKLGSKCPRTRRCGYDECPEAGSASRTSQGHNGAGTPRDGAGAVPGGECGWGDGSRQDESGLLISGQTVRSDLTTDGLDTSDLETGHGRVRNPLQRCKMAAQRPNCANATIDVAPQPREDRLLPFRSSGEAKVIPKSTQPSDIAPPSYSEKDGPDMRSYSRGDIFMCLFSIGTYFLDVGSDCGLVYLYFAREKWWYFGLTLAFIIIPGLTVTTFSVAWYIEDHRRDKSPGEKEIEKPLHPAHWVSRFMLLFLQLGPVMRYIETLIYGLWSRPGTDAEEEWVKRRKKLWYKMMQFESTDSCLLRLIECFMESAPQLVLQLYVMNTYGKGFGNTILWIKPEREYILVGWQAFSCVTALTSLSWALASYHKALRCSLDNKAKMSYKGMAMQFFWRFFTIGSRVLALAIFASVFGAFVFVILSVHWILMFVWICILNTDFCKNRCQEIFFDIVMAAVYIFCYLNLKEGHTRLRYIFFYTIMYVENAGMLLAWYLVSKPEEAWRVWLSMVVILLGFFIGILFQCLYYQLCHPNNAPTLGKKAKIKRCIPCSVLWPTLCNLATESQGEEEDSQNLNTEPQDDLDTTAV